MELSADRCLETAAGGIPIWPRLRRRALGIAPAEADFDRRGFVADRAARAHLERIGQTFIAGYGAALEDGPRDGLVRALERLDADVRGFGYEGAAMALTLLDELTLRRGRRLGEFLEAGADAHVYMVHVGAGWALARLRRRPDRAIGRFDRVLRWLVVDGYGFHQGYFHPGRHLERGRRPLGLSPPARRAFDEGLGRSLWFAHGADPPRIAATIARFPATRRADLWSGVGLAAAYAGGAGRAQLQALADVGVDHRLELAQGAAFAAAARLRAGNPTAATDLACRVLCRTSLERAAGVTAETRLDLPPDGQRTGYEVWRARIRARLAESS